jgi:hypothetical protein
MPYKYIRLLSNADYYIDYDSQEEFFNQDNNPDDQNKTAQRDEDHNNPINTPFVYVYRPGSLVVYPVDNTKIPKY